MWTFDMKWKPTLQIYFCMKNSWKEICFLKIPFKAIKIYSTIVAVWPLTSVTIKLKACLWGKHLSLPWSCMCVHVCYFKYNCLEMSSVDYVVCVVCLPLDGSIVLVKDRQVISLPHISFRDHQERVYHIHVSWIKKKIYLTKLD